MTGMLHYMLACSGCHNCIISLPLETLGPSFGPLALRTSDSEPVAVVCEHCKKVRNYDLAKKSQNPPWGPMVLLPHDSGWRYLGWLECGEAFCKARLPLFAHVNESMSPEERMKSYKSWDWSGLVCPTGHPIPEPK